MAERPRVYVDSSALLKLILVEPESGAMGRFARSVSLVMSVAGTVEAVRAVRRSHSGAVAQAVRVVRSIVTEVPVNEDAVQGAVAVEPPTVRSLDAMHLGTALALGQAIDAFVTYDRRLAAAARHAGLRVLEPR